MMLRRMLTMATYRTTRCSPFAQAVVNSMRKLYPESLADKSFDNTGLLLEAPCRPSTQLNNSVLLTIDLTRAVADEAIRRKDSVVVAYHPVIFRGLKSITLNDPQTDSILRLAQEGISVYSPHTAVDAVPGGMADWLCDIVTGSGSMVSRDTPSSTSGAGPQPGSEQTSSDTQPQQQQPPPLPPRRQESTAIIPHTRAPINPNPAPPPGFEDAGTGRLVTFATPQPLSKLTSRLAWSATTSTSPSPMKVPLALPQTSSASNLSDILISTVATCPGSGSSILLKDGAPVADLLITGELSHHAALGAIERGSVVAALFHSNSERGYLERVMRSKLADTLRVEWGVVREEMAQSLDAESEEMQQLLGDEGVEVAVSEMDRDPYVIVDEAANTLRHPT